MSDQTLMTMTLTPAEWPYVLDALGAAVAELNEQAEMWSCGVFRELRGQLPRGSPIARIA